MKMQKNAVLLLPIFLILLQGSKCTVSNDLDVDALDVTKYTTNWTQMSRVADFRGNWNETTKNWQELAIDKLGGADVLDQRLLPAYVPVFAGNCNGSAIFKSGNPQTQVEIQAIIDAFRKNEDEAGQRNNVVLIGEPGIDVDARIKALAWRIAKGCEGVPEGWKMREVISVDLRKLRDDAKAKNLTSASFISVLNKILDEWGSRAIFYLNGFSELANQPVNVSDVIRLFLQYNASVVFEATPAEFNQYFSDRETTKIVHQQNLLPLPSELILPAISALAAIDAKTENVTIGADATEDVVRLSRAFLPGRGSLSQAVRALNRSVQDAMSGSGNRVVDRKMVINAVYLLDSEKLQARAIESSDALDRGVSLAQIDSNVWLLKEYYIDVQSRNLMADAVKRELDPAFDDLNAKVKNVSSLVAQAERNVLDGLVAKTNLLRTRIANMGRKLDATELRITQGLVKQSALIVEKYEALSGKVDSAKAELLNKVIEAQGVIIANVDKRFGELTQKQEDLMNQLSWTHIELANRISEVDTRVQKASAAALDTIAKLELRIGQELEFVSDSVASLMVEVTKANRSLASLASQVETLSKNEAETFNQLLRTHDVLVKQALPKLTELTDPQIGVIASLQNAVSSLTLSFNKGHESIVRTLTNVQGEIAQQFESLGKKLTEQESRVLAEIAKANSSLAIQSTQIANLSKNEAETFNQLLRTHDVLVKQALPKLFELTDPQLGVFAALNAATAAITTSINKGNNATLATLVNVQGEIAQQFESLGKKLTEQESRVLAEIAKANSSLAIQSTQIANLSKNEAETFNQLLRTHDVLVKQALPSLTELTDPQSGVLAALNAATKSLSDAFRSGNEAIVVKLTNIQDEVAQKFKSLGKQLSDQEATLLIELAKATDGLAVQSRKLDALSTNQQNAYSKLVATHDLIAEDVTRELQSLTSPQKGFLAALNSATKSLSDAFRSGNDAIVVKLTNVQEEVAQKFKSLGKQLSDQEATLLMELAKANDSLATQSTKLDTLSTSQQNAYSKLLATHDLIAEDVTRELQSLTSPQKGVLAALNSATKVLSDAFKIGNDAIIVKLTNVQEEVAQKFKSLGNKLSQQESTLLTELTTANAALATQASKLDTLSAEQQKTYNQLLETHRVLSNDVTKELGKLSTAQTEVLGPLSAATAILSDAIQKGNETIISSLSNVQETIVRQFDSLGNKLTTQEATVLAEIAKANASLAIQSTQLGTLSTNERQTYVQLLETHKILSENVTKNLASLTDPQLGVLAALNASTANITNAFKSGNEVIISKLTSVQGAIAQQFDSLGSKITEQESKVLAGFAEANQGFAEVLNLALTDKNAPIQSRIVKSIAKSLGEFETIVKASFREKLDEVRPTLVFDIQKALEALVQAMQEQVLPTTEIESMTKNITDRIAALKGSLFQIEGLVFDGDKVIASIMENATPKGKCLPGSAALEALKKEARSADQRLLACGQWCIEVPVVIKYKKGVGEDRNLADGPFIQKLNYQGKTVEFNCIPY